MVERYVQQVLVQMRALAGALGERRFARFALGGGTPTYLSPAQLDTLLCGARDILGIDLQTTPAGIEASPETITAERLAVCRAHGIDRVSLGIQSFAAKCARWPVPSKTPPCIMPSA
jgi:oxygen-independent coproporphyrinogen-3 oxidase